MDVNIPANLAENATRLIMDELSISELEAQEWKAGFLRKYYGDRERIFAFLKEHNPKATRMEQSGDYSRRIKKIAGELQISETTATAIVITGELLAEGGLKILRKRKKKSALKDFQEMLGVSVPIPQDVLDALGIDDA